MFIAQVLVVENLEVEVILYFSISCASLKSFELVLGSGISVSNSVIFKRYLPGLAVDLLFRQSQGF